MAEHESRKNRKIGLLRDDMYFARIGRLWIGETIQYTYNGRHDDDFQVSFTTDKRFAQPLDMSRITLLNKYFDLSIYETSQRELSMAELGDKIKQYKEGENHD